ncbi:WG repeat-containing protein [Mangrovibacterium marinum]|uniref:WG repeat-containing protein n=1 Tax=Mangrovibacterium marinum TaxID=1639118 RepID=UPI002A187A3F|nr:WG repeat-containing protein [Mangrovibacterium marinum]
MKNIILVVDIETTGFLEEGGKIVEIGIVKLDLDSGEIYPAYNSLIKEPGFDDSHRKEPFGWIFRNSDLTFDEVMDAPTLESQREMIQFLFDKYPATAYNKDFDFSFLRDREFSINDLPCPMIILTDIMKLPSKKASIHFKWPSVKESWNYLFSEKLYSETHRGLTDATFEAKIVYRLYQIGQYELANPIQPSVKKLIPYNGRNGWGFKTIKGEIEINAIYNWVTPFIDGIAKVGIGDKIIYINEEAKEVESHPENLDIEKQSDFTVKDRYICDKNGERIAYLFYGHSTSFYCNRLCVFDQYGTYGFLDEKGEVAIELKYEYAESFSEELAAVKYGGKWGYINTGGQMVIPCSFNSAENFKNGLAKIDGNNFINKKGQIVAHSKLDWSEGLLCVDENWRYGYIGKNGKLVIPCKFDYAKSFSEGLAAVNKDSHWGFIDKHGKMIVELKYGVVHDFKEGFAGVRKEDWGFINRNGELLVDCIFNFVASFHEGLAAVCIKEGEKFKWGFIDINGEITIPCIYDDVISSFTDGIARVRYNNNENYINRKGEFIISIDYPSVCEIDKGLIPVRNDDNHWAFFDKTGRELTPFIFSIDEVHSIINGVNSYMDLLNNKDLIKEILKKHY